MLTMQNLSKIYRTDEVETVALNNVNIDIERGEFVAIMGRSGSGKSTLLNMLGCLDRPDAGEYRLDDQDVAGMPDDELSAVRNRYMGFIFQSFHLLPRMTALENVVLPRRYAPEGIRPEDYVRASDLLVQVDLGERRGHKPNELSGGQRQRVAIARALINEPRVILADEPTGNLDSRTSDAIMELLRRLNAEGQTIVMVTHEPDIAEFAARQIVMQDGRVLEDVHAAA